jgi:dihydrofolate reductase
VTPPRIALVAAMGQDRVIGVGNRLPWRLPADMKHFRTLTVGKTVLMGRKTFESIGKPLAGRANVVVTQDRLFHAEGVRVAHSIDEALALAADETEVMVIGGASFYAQLLPRAERLYLTEIHQRFAGDAFFPAWDPAAWRETAREDHGPDHANPYAYSFVTLERRTP